MPTCSAKVRLSEIVLGLVDDLAVSRAQQRRPFFGFARWPEITGLFEAMLALEPDESSSQPKWMKSGRG
jgi:hypothetical protein